MGSKDITTDQPGAGRGSGAPTSVVAGVAALALAVALGGCGHGHVTRASSPPRSTTTSQAPGPIPPPATIAPFPSPSTTTTTKPAATTTTTVPPDVAQRAALLRLLSTLAPHSYAASNIVRTPGRDLVAVAHDVGPFTAVIDIYRFQGLRLVVEAAGVGSAQNLDPVEPGSIQTARVTDSSVPDFLVLLDAGDHANGVLVSEARGTWHLVGLSDRSGAAASPELVDPRLVGRTITQAINDCTPSCANGSFSVTTYGYDPGSAELTPIGPPATQATP